MKILILLFVFALNTYATDFEPNFKFEYVPMELDRTACVHSRIKDLPDWEVICETPYGRKSFVAHVIFRESVREKTSSIEILYWVTARSENANTPPKFHSTSAMMHFKDKAEPFQMTLSQGVENDSAFLNMTWRKF